MRGKSTENEVATGSSICSKDTLSLSGNFCFRQIPLLYSPQALVSIFPVSKDFSLFFNPFHDLNFPRARFKILLLFWGKCSKILFSTNVDL